MTITLDLTSDVEASLRCRAARRGQESEAVALRASSAAFAAEWERPEMEVCGDYDAAKARLEAKA